jgi:hypothetical protein
VRNSRGSRGLWTRARANQNPLWPRPDTDISCHARGGEMQRLPTVARVRLGYLPRMLLERTAWFGKMAVLLK